MLEGGLVGQKHRSMQYWTILFCMQDSTAIDSHRGECEAIEMQRRCILGTVLPNRTLTIYVSLSFCLCDGHIYRYMYGYTYVSCKPIQTPMLPYQNLLN